MGKPDAIYPPLVITKFDPCFESSNRKVLGFKRPIVRVPLRCVTSCSVHAIVVGRLGHFIGNIVLVVIGACG